MEAHPAASPEACKDCAKLLADLVTEKTRADSLDGSVRILVVTLQTFIAARGELAANLTASEVLLGHAKRQLDAQEPILQALLASPDLREALRLSQAPKDPPATRQP